MPCYRQLFHVDLLRKSLGEWRFCSRQLPPLSVPIQFNSKRPVYSRHPVLDVILEILDDLFDELLVAATDQAIVQKQSKDGDPTVCITGIHTQICCPDCFYSRSVSPFFKRKKVRSSSLSGPQI